MPSESVDLRPGILDLLELLSSRDRQLEYERSVPHVAIPTELTCMWFDDQYVPESESFKRCFSQEELAAMAAFNRYFDDQQKDFPEDTGSIGHWLTTDVWQGVMSEASKALSVLRP